MNGNALQGKVALVTGASSGIGEATALALAAEGASVALAARRVERLETLAQRITAAGGTALPLACDVAEEEQVQRAVQDIQDKWGRLDILVNNAGLSVIGPILGGDTDAWRRLVNVNVLGLMYATRAVLPLMKEQGGGHIINLSSVAGRTTTAGLGVYSATKWAVGGFSESLRQEAVAYKVRVTVIEPGQTASEMVDIMKSDPAQAAILAQFGPLPALESADVAAAVLYAVMQPDHVSVNELLVRPSEQVF